MTLHTSKFTEQHTKRINFIVCYNKIKRNISLIDKVMVW